VCGSTWSEVCGSTWSEVCGSTWRSVHACYCFTSSFDQKEVMYKGTYNPFILAKIGQNMQNNSLYCLLGTKIAN
jgi:hypothetical protein